MTRFGIRLRKPTFRYEPLLDECREESQFELEPVSQHTKWISTKVDCIVQGTQREVKKQDVKFAITIIRSKSMYIRGQPNHLLIEHS